MDLGIKGRVALITGASGGVGLATARQLHEEGVQLVLSDMDQQKLEEAYTWLKADSVFVAADMTQQDQVARVVGRQGAAARGPR